MRPLCLLFWAALLSGCLLASPTSAPSDVTGTWIFQVETDAGSGSPTFTFKQDGENLTGTYKGLFGEAAVAGTVKDSAISFSFKVNSQGIEGVMTYTGTVEGDTMKGKVTLSEIGEGTFTAKRQ
jgi:hypothetical protein